MKPKILLVDDEEAILAKMRLALEPAYHVFTANTEDEAANVFKEEKPPVITLDLSLNPLDVTDLAGMRLLARILSADSSTRVIVVTANSDNNNASQALLLGAFDYFAKPVRLDELKIILGRAFYLNKLLQRIPFAVRAAGNGFGDLVGKSKATKGIMQAIDRLADSDAPVLIYGEPGTGKETIARAIHCKSRRTGPFVHLNCGEISSELFERELFGRNAVLADGGNRRVRAKFEPGHSGTLFLEAIGGLSQDLQGKLLNYFSKVSAESVTKGRSGERTTRIIAATTRDLRTDSEGPTFSCELYSRLTAETMDVLPLRDRTEDIIPLAEHFLHQFCLRQHKPAMTLSAEAQGALLMHTWTGNVRELADQIGRAVADGDQTVLKPSHLGFALDQIPTGMNLKSAKSVIERGFVNRALSRNCGVVSRAARELGISRVNLYELIEKYCIQLQQFKVRRTTGKHQSRIVEVSQFEYFEDQAGKS